MCVHTKHKEGEEDMEAVRLHTLIFKPNKGWRKKKKIFLPRK